MRGVEQIPGVYDTLFWVLERGGFSRLRRRLLGGAVGRVLEIGSGTGRNLPLYGAGARVIGVDVDLASLRVARRRAPHVPLVRASAEALPFRDGVFDTAVSSLVFCSVPDPRRGLLELRRVLRDEGRLHMLEHVRASRRWLARLQDWLQPAWTRIAGGCHPNRETEREVRAAGFAIDEPRRRRGEVFRLFTAHKSAAQTIEPQRMS